MTTEVEIFKKYKPTEDGWISNTKFRQAIHEAYEAGKPKTLERREDVFSAGFLQGEKSAAYAKHKGSAPSIYDEAEAQVKQKISQAIFGDIEKGYHICENEEWCCRQCVEGEDIPCPCWIALKAKYLKVKPKSD